MIIKEKSQEQINSGSGVAKIFYDILATENPIDQDKEHLWVMGLNTKNQIEYIELATLGILNYAAIHPRETFRLAILKGVYSIIVCHNHPSGNIEPSDSDAKVMSQLQQAGEIIGITLLDSIIIGKPDGSLEYFTSFKERGLI